MTTALIKFTELLAPALGGVAVISRDDSARPEIQDQYARCRIELPAAGIVLSLSNGYGAAGRGRFTVGAYVDKATSGNLSAAAVYDLANLPKCTIAADSPIDRAAKHVMARIVAQSVAPVDAVRAAAQARDNDRATLDSTVAAWRAKFPTVEIRVDPGDSYYAELRFYGRDTGANIRGRLSGAGVLTVDRISGLSCESSLAIVAAVIAQERESGK